MSWRVDRFTLLFWAGEHHALVRTRLLHTLFLPSLMTFVCRPSFCFTPFGITLLLRIIFLTLSANCWSLASLAAIINALYVAFSPFIFFHMCRSTLSFLLSVVPRVQVPNFLFFYAIQSQVWAQWLPPDQMPPSCNCHILLSNHLPVEMPNRKKESWDKEECLLCQRLCVWYVTSCGYSLGTYWCQNKIWWKRPATWRTGLTSRGWRRTLWGVTLYMLVRN